MQVETVKVVAEVSEDNPLGYVVINKEDFIEGDHELYEEAENQENAGTTGSAESKSEGTGETAPPSVSTNPAVPAWAPKQ